MGYIKTNPVEEVVRDTFRLKKKATFWELVQAGFPSVETLSYSDALALQNRDEAGRLSQYELALDLCLKYYFDLGLVYPARWKTYLENYVDFVRDRNEQQGKGNQVIFASDARASVEPRRGYHWELPILNELASPVCRAMNGWTKDVPPWFEQPARIRNKVKMRVCRMVIVFDVLPDQDADEIARPVEWIASEKLFDAPRFGGVDL